MAWITKSGNLVTRGGQAVTTDTGCTPQVYYQSRKCCDLSLTGQWVPSTLLPQPFTGAVVKAGDGKCYQIFGTDSAAFGTAPTLLSFGSIVSGCGDAACPCCTDCDDVTGGVCLSCDGTGTPRRIQCIIAGNLMQPGEEDALDGTPICTFGGGSADGTWECIYDPTFGRCVWDAEGAGGGGLYQFFDDPSHYNPGCQPCTVVKQAAYDAIRVQVILQVAGGVTNLLVVAYLLYFTQQSGDCAVNGQPVPFTCGVVAFSGAVVLNVAAFLRGAVVSIPNQLPPNTSCQPYGMGGVALVRLCA